MATLRRLVTIYTGGQAIGFQPQERTDLGVWKTNLTSSTQQLRNGWLAGPTYPVNFSVGLHTLLTRPDTYQAFFETVRALYWDVRYQDADGNLLNPEEFGGILYILDEDDLIIIEYLIRDVDFALQSDRQTSYAVGVHIDPLTASLHESIADIPIAADTDLKIGWGYVVSEISEVSNVERVWAEIVDGGTNVGLLSLGGTAAQVAGTEESATIIVRYAPQRLSGAQVVDDLGRIWSVTSTRILEDRRFIEYQLSRTVQLV